MANLGGDCGSPISGLERCNKSDRISFQGALYEPDGNEVFAMKVVEHIDSNKLSRCADIGRKAAERLKEKIRPDLLKWLISTDF